MKRRYLISIGLFALSTIGASWLSGAVAKPKPIKAFQPTTADEKAIMALIKAQNQSQERPEIITRLVIADQYGIYSWLIGEHSGGQTLVKKDNKGNWKTIRGSGGMFDADLLIKTFKVPEVTAKALVAKMDAQIKADRP